MNLNATSINQAYIGFVCILGTQYILRSQNLSSELLLINKAIYRKLSTFFLVIWLLLEIVYVLFHVFSRRYSFFIKKI